MSAQQVFADKARPANFSVARFSLKGFKGFEREYIPVFRKKIEDSLNKGNDVKRNWAGRKTRCLWIELGSFK